MGSTSQDPGHKSSKKRAVISGVAGVTLKKDGAPLQQLARTDSMEYRKVVLRAETPDRNALARAVKGRACRGVSCCLKRI
jgi:hypothetical protein